MANALLYYLIVINVVTFLVYGFDKWMAKKGSWRISEATLLILAVIGGSRVVELKIYGIVHVPELVNVVETYLQRHHIVKLVITFFCHLIRLNLCINRLQRYKKFWKVIRIYNIFRIFAIRFENRSFKMEEIGILKRRGCF